MKKQKQILNKVVWGYCIAFSIFLIVLNFAGYELFYAKTKRAEVERQRQEDLQNISDNWSAMSEDSKVLDTYPDAIREYEDDIRGYLSYNDPELYKKDIIKAREDKCEMELYYNMQAGDYNAWMFQAYDKFPNLEELLEEVRSTPLPRRHELVPECLDTKEEK